MFNESKNEIRELLEENSELRKSFEFSQNEMEEIRKEMSNLKFLDCYNSSLSNRGFRLVVRSSFVYLSVSYTLFFI